MNWERKALETLILLLAEEDKQFDKLYTDLAQLGVELNLKSPGLEVLSSVLSGDWIEDLETYQNGDYTQEEYLEICMELIEKKINKK